MQSTITQKQQEAIRDWLSTHELSKGLGTKEAACSIAAINLALTGELTARIPDCMSLVIGKWIIKIQDEMPAEMRNNLEWKTLLPLAAGTGRKLEKVRQDLIQDWLWKIALPYLQELADQHGFGPEWKNMCQEKTIESAKKAADTAYITAHTFNAAYAAYAAYAAVADAAYTSDAVCTAVAASQWTKKAKDYTEAWQHFNPSILLKQLIDVSE